jgi:hypothetical protein
MKKGLLLVLLLAVILTSCSNDEEKNIEISNDLNGKWEMTSYVALLPSLPVINPNEIEWTFDLEISQLTIVNNIELEYPYILTSGSYNDIIITDNTITISGVEYDYAIENGILNISDDSELDGPSMSFVSN